MRVNNYVADDFPWNVFGNICLIIIYLKVLLNIYNIIITEIQSDGREKTYEKSGAR